jgi:organic hydroperoxide reductase OsmC/OhrA
MEFKIFFTQTSEDTAPQNNRERFITLVCEAHMPELKVQLPVGYEGPATADQKAQVHTPEHLFLGSISGCFFTTFSVISSNSQLSYNSLSIKTVGTMEIVNEVKQMSRIQQDITLTLPFGSNAKKAQRILEKTEELCPLANSITSKIDNTYSIIMLEEV